MSVTKAQAQVTLHGALRLVASSDVAIVYGAAVVLIAVVLQLLPDSAHQDVVLKCSTNLANLREHPIYVLLVSAWRTRVAAGWGPGWCCSG